MVKLLFFYGKEIARKTLTEKQQRHTISNEKGHIKTQQRLGN